MKLSLLATCLLCPLLLAAQKPTVTAVEAIYDSSAVAELYNRVPIGLEMTYSDGSIRQTENMLDGNYRWRQIKVTTPDGAFSNGFLTFDRNKLSRQDYKVKLFVTLPDGAGKTFETSLQLPHIIGIRFNHYADSLKRDIHFYLNVEGRFSSGKVFPLDTSAIRFETSAGKLLGQDLLLEKNDTVRLITVKAYYKADPSLQAQSVVPVKQKPDDESMIINDEKELFRKKKRRN